jgi:hypothetical protein
MQEESPVSCEYSILLSSTPASASLHRNLRCARVCVPAKAVCQRGCLSDGGIITPIGNERSGMPRLLMSLELIYCACIHCAVYVFISYLPACMYALRPGLDELLCFAWLARLKRETKRAVLVVCRVVSAGCCCCVTGTVLLVRDGVGLLFFVGWEWEIWERDGALV